MQLLDTTRPEAQTVLSGVPSNAPMPLLPIVVGVYVLHVLAIAGLGIMISGHVGLGCSIFYAAEVAAYITGKAVTA